MVPTPGDEIGRLDDIIKWKNEIGPEESGRCELEDRRAIILSKSIIGIMKGSAC